MTPGQRITHGTRQPPSQFVSFSDRNGVVPPSGQVNTSAPLSVDHITIVLSAMPRSSSFLRSWPTIPSCSTMPSGYVPRPVTPCDSFFRCVKMCIRVELNQQKNGLPSFCDFSMNLSAPSRNSSSIVSMRLVFNGPVFSIFCLPTLPNCGSSVGSSLSVAQLWSTPRGPNFFLNSGFLG